MDSLNVQKEKEKEQRLYIRHPIQVPIKIEQNCEHCSKKSENNCSDCSITHDLGCSGLSFESKYQIKNNSIILIKMELYGEVFEITAKVAWSRKEKDFYLIGVEFLKDNPVFKIKMMNQICQIIKYSVENNLPEHIAAEEWIKNNAAMFHEKYFY